MTVNCRGGALIIFILWITGVIHAVSNSSFVQEFHCEWNSSAILKCTWKLAEPDDQANYTFTWKRQNGNEYVCNDRESRSIESYCVIESDKFNTFSTYNITLYVSAHNDTDIYTDSISTNCSIFRLEKVSVSEVKINVSSVSLNITKPFYCDSRLTYEIKYKARFEKEEKTEKIDSDKIILEGLYPGATYHISVSAKPEEGVFWSEPAIISVTLNESAPTTSPYIPVGCYKTFRCEVNKTSCRNIILMWQPIPEPDRNGVITGYNMVLEGEESKEYEVPADQTYVELRELSPDATYHVQLTANNSAGVSPLQYTYIANQTAAPDLIYVIIENDNSSQLHLHWTPEGTTNSYYTLFICKGNHELNKCMGALDFINFYPNSTCGNYPVSISGLEEAEAVYAVSHNDVRNNASSGMQAQWVCPYNYWADPLKPDFYFPEDQEERSLYIRLEAPDQDPCTNPNIAFTWNYNLTLTCCFPEWKEVARQGVVSYDEPFPVFYNLTPNTDYRVQLEALSQKSVSKSDTQLFKTRESRPDDPPQNISVQSSQDFANITWHPPNAPNGIVKYDVKIGKVFKKGLNDAYMVLNYTELDGYMNYSVSVTAKNSAGSSPPSEHAHFLTPMRGPSAVKNLSVMRDQKDHSVMYVNWSKPVTPHGPISLYMVNVSWGSAKHENIQKNVSGNITETIISLPCEEELILTTLTVMAINKDEDGEYIGVSANAETLEMCRNIVKPFSVLAIGLMSTLLVVIAICLLVTWCFRKSIRESIIKRLSIPISRIDFPIQLNSFDNGCSTTFTHSLYGKDKQAARERKMLQNNTRIQDHHGHNLVGDTLGKQDNGTLGDNTVRESYSRVAPVQDSPVTHRNNMGVKATDLCDVLHNNSTLQSQPEIPCAHLIPDEGYADPIKMAPAPPFSILEFPDNPLMHDPDKVDMNEEIHDLYEGSETESLNMCGSQTELFYPCESNVNASDSLYSQNDARDYAKVTINTEHDLQEEGLMNYYAHQSIEDDIEDYSNTDETEEEEEEDEKKDEEENEVYSHKCSGKDSGLSNISTSGDCLIIDVGTISCDTPV